MRLFASLNADTKRVAGLIGINEGYLTKCSVQPPRWGAGDKLSQSHRRFFASLILHDVVQEVALATICQRSV